MNKLSKKFSIYPSHAMNHDLQCDIYTNKTKYIFHVYMIYEHRESYNYMFDVSGLELSRMIARFLYNPYYNLRSDKENILLFRTNDIWNDILDFDLSDNPYMSVNDIKIDLLDLGQVCSYFKIDQLALADVIRESFDMLNDEARERVAKLIVEKGYSDLWHIMFE